MLIEGYKWLHVINGAVKQNGKLPTFRTVTEVKRWSNWEWWKGSSLTSVITAPFAIFANGEWRNPLWTLTQRLEKRLEIFENWVLRKICGPVIDREEGKWCRRHNREIHDITKVPCCKTLSEHRSRLRWAGHVVRIEDGELIKEALTKKPQGRRPDGRPRKRWCETVRRDVCRTYGREDWTVVAQNRTVCRNIFAVTRGLHGLKPPEWVSVFFSNALRP